MDSTRKVPGDGQICINSQFLNVFANFKYLLVIHEEVQCAYSLTSYTNHYKINTYMYTALLIMSE